MHAPQLIYLALTFLGLGRSISKHGEVKTSKENAWASIIAACLIVGVLYWGGFFSH